MTTRRTGLGRGLGSLIPQNELHESENKYRELPTNSISPNPNQPRKAFDEEALTSLAASISSMGIIQPIIVQENEEGNYTIIAGERRWRAARRVGLDLVPAIVQSGGAQINLEQALVENLHREDLNPVEEAMAFQSLIEEYSYTHESLAKRIGKSRAVISNALRLLTLPTAVQRLLVEKKISPGHARLLMTISDRNAQETIARVVFEQDLSVRALEEMLKNEEHERKGEKVATSKKAKLKPPAIIELERVLYDYFDSKVEIQLTKKNEQTTGKIVIAFENLEDLRRITEQMIEEQ
ncbi:MAG: ParB/RepB/Spo0J family partition protein [Actinomycetota bacterium]|nr:ParB/RepB/Spo0J family partition protein [Actinomycetota bacterium]